MGRLSGIRADSRHFRGVLCASGAWYVAPALRARSGLSRAVPGGFAVVALAALGGCGGGERQDAAEAGGTYKVAIERASFPKRQAVAQQAAMRIVVRNEGTRTLRQVAVSVDSLDTQLDQSDLGDRTRPVWVVDRGPKDGDTAYVGTWTARDVRPGDAKTFSWDLTAVRPGIYDVRYRVSAGLTGKARAVLADGGGAPDGRFRVTISDAPDQVTIGPDGEIVREGPEGESTEK